jgi:hypothetical protein
MGSGPASISPGAKGKNDTGLLTIQSSLTFGAQGSYQCELDSDSVTTDTLNANGVTIGRVALFHANDLGSSALTPGTVFLVIANTSATPISGAFSNLPDGGILNVGGNNLQASYEGGDGKTSP